MKKCKPRPTCVQAARRRHLLANFRFRNTTGPSASPGAHLPLIGQTGCCNRRFHNPGLFPILGITPRGIRPLEVILVVNLRCKTEQITPKRSRALSYLLYRESFDNCHDYVNIIWQFSGSNCSPRGGKLARNRPPGRLMKDCSYLRPLSGDATKNLMLLVVLIVILMLLLSRNPLCVLFV